MFFNACENNQKGLVDLVITYLPLSLPWFEQCLLTVGPLNNGHIGSRDLVLCWEVIRILEGPLSEISLYLPTQLLATTNYRLGVKWCGNSHY